MKSEWRLVEKLPNGERYRRFVDGKPTPNYRIELQAGDPIVEAQVFSGGNDGSRYTGTGGFATDRSIDYIGLYGDPSLLECSYFGLWEGISLSGTIDQSYIQLYQRGGAEGAPELKVHVVLANNPPAPLAAEEFDTAPLSPGVDWDGPWLGESGWITSPELRAEFQELVDSYEVNNAKVMVQIRNDGGLGVYPGKLIGVANFDYAPSLSAKLFIEYTEGEIPPVLHTITAIAGVGGIINPAGEVSVNEGDDITFSVTPADGYAIADVLVNGISVGIISSYTFENVTSDNTIEAIFAEIPPTVTGDETTPTSLDLIPTFECAGVYANYSGDNNGNNNAILEYRRVGTSRWIRGMDLTPDKRENLYIAYQYVANPYYKQFRGSVLGLTPNTEYEVRVTFDDPEGVLGTNPLTAIMRTRDDSFPGSGRDYYVSPGGDDAGDGSISSPWLNLETVIDRVAPGDTINLRSGLYMGSFAISRSGTPSNYITLRNYENETVIIDGGNIGDIFLFNQASYWRIYGLSIMNARNHCVLFQHQSRYNVVDHCRLLDFGYYNTDSGVGMTTGSDYTTVQHNYISSSRTANPDTIHRASGVSAYYITNYAPWPEYAQMGLVMRYNEITGEGLGDGFGGEYNTFFNRDGLNRDADVYRNYVHDIGDDAFECEGSDMNVRIWENMAVNSLTGIGLHSPVIGPAYIVRNSFIGQRSSILKCGSGSTNPFAGDVYIYHNSAYTLYSAEGRVSGLSQDGGLLWLNHHLRNNIIVTSGYTLDVTPLSIDPILGNSYDYDCLYQPRQPECRLARWGSTIIYSGLLSEFQSLSGQELHGQGGYDTVGNPLFVNPAGGDLRLQAGSPCINAGVIIQGFNDPDSPWPYNDNAPDIGAIEYGSTAAAPLAGFTAAPTSGNAPLTVQFTDSSIGVIDNRQWDFGDGQLSSEVNPIHQYLTAGIFTVTLTVSGEGGDSQSILDIEVKEIHNLTIEALSGGSTSPAPGTYQREGTVTITALPDAGYSFSHWEENGSLLTEDNPVNILMDADRTIVAVFEEIVIPPTDYSVTLSVLGSGTTNPAAGSFTVGQGETLIIEATPSAGWRFDHWEGDIEGSTSRVEFTVERNMSVMAVFSQSLPPSGDSKAVIAGVVMAAIIIPAIFVRRKR